MDRALQANTTKVISAPIEEVFRAWTEPEIMKKWYSPPGVSTPKAESDLRIGGKYSVFMKGQGIEYPVSGKYLEVDEPNKLVFTWNDDNSIVTVNFKALDENKTEVSITHSGFVSEESRDQHEEGWVGCLASLEQNI